MIAQGRKGAGCAGSALAILAWPGGYPWGRRPPAHVTAVVAATAASVVAANASASAAVAAAEASAIETDSFDQPRGHCRHPGQHSDNATNTIAARAEADAWPIAKRRRFH